jgi:hypothetical protein
MTNDEIDKIIQQIKLESSEKEALLGFFSDHDHNHIMANKSGLELYAVEFLNAAKEIEKRDFKDGESEIFGIKPSWIQHQDNNPLAYIELTSKKRSEIVFDEKIYKSTWKDKIFSAGCIVLILFMIFLFIVGLGNFLTWF